MTHSAKVRALIACCALALVFTGFSARLVHLQVTMHDTWADVARARHGTKQIIYAQRGLIMDVNNQTLADNEPARMVIADDSMISDPDGNTVGLWQPAQT